MIKRKRNSMQKYLRRDIADLLKNELDINAYGRAEGLLVELNMSASYDFVEQFCGSISSHLSLMSKQRECPEECREAVPSLMFAAARFADLPELRELRSIFADRYGNSLEASVNQQFVEKLKAMPPTKNMKLQLLQDIALESGLQWNSKALEQKLYNPPASDQESNANDDHKHDCHKIREEPVQRIDQDPPNKQHHVKNGDPETNTPSGDSQGASTNQNDQQKNSNSDRNVSYRENDDEKKPFYYRFIPPPYTKPKAAGETDQTSLEVPPAQNQTSCPHDSVGEAKPKPKPKSVRRRNLKLPPGNDNIGGGKEAAKLGLKSEHGDCNVFHELNDEEEEMVMDRLLIHYSTKESSSYGVGKAKAAALKPPSSQQPAIVDAGDVIKNRTSRDGLPARAASLPLEPASSTETSKGHGRAASLQPDTGGHGHHKPPDYEDFVARLAALRGK
ncbi:hypothetical protein U1Q18_006618 [Sarracenia purpurea var. burkii]